MFDYGVISFTKCKHEQIDNVFILFENKNPYIQHLLNWHVKEELQQDFRWYWPLKAWMY